MKTTLKHIGILGIIFSVTILVLGVWVFESAIPTNIGISGFILSPLLKSLGD